MIAGCVRALVFFVFVQLACTHGTPAPTYSPDVQKMEDMAMNLANEVFTKNVVPMVNGILPKQVVSAGCDPMAHVCSTSSLKVTDLVGASNFQVQSLIVSSIMGSTEFYYGISTTLKANMMLTGTVSPPMTAIGTFTKKSSPDAHADSQAQSTHTKHKRRLGAVKDAKAAGKDTKPIASGIAQVASRISSDADDAMGGTYVMSFKDVTVTIPMVGTISTSTGASFQPSSMLDSLKQLSITSITNGTPQTSMNIKLQCAIADVDCHEPDGLVDGIQPVIDMVVGNAMTSIVQNTFNEVLPMPLGSKSSKNAFGSIQGKILVQASHERKLQSLANEPSITPGRSLYSKDEMLLFASDENVLSAFSHALGALAGISPTYIKVNASVLRASDIASIVSVDYIVNVVSGLREDVYEVESRLIACDLLTLSGDISYQTKYDVTMMHHSSAVTMARLDDIGEYKSRTHSRSGHAPMGRTVTRERERDSRSWSSVALGIGAALAAILAMAVICWYTIRENGEAEKTRSRDIDLQSARAEWNPQHAHTPHKHVKPPLFVNPMHPTIATSSGLKAQASFMSLLHRANPMQPAQYFSLPTSHY